MRLHVFQHAAFEGPARIADWAKTRGHALAATALYQGVALPAQEEVDFLIVMGGPLSVHDEQRFPWLRAEKEFIRRTVEDGKPVLGVCLGAQLLADVFGARVYKNEHKEIGWFPVRRTPAAAGLPSFRRLPDSFTAFHWHGETFDLPSGAVHLAASDACVNQAFQLGRALAVQFHVEVTTESVNALLWNCSADLGPGLWQQTPEQIRGTRPAYAALKPLLSGILDGLTGASA